MLHITNGDIAAGLIRAAIPGAEVLPWRDMLHDGPVPKGLAPEALARVRATYLAGETGRAEAEILGSLETRDTRLRAALTTGEPVRLWLEHDLYDQLQLIQILAFPGIEASAVELVQAEVYLGTSTVSAIAALEREARPLTAAQRDLAVAAWAAFRAPTPEPLARLVDREPAELPYLGPALRRLLEELPGQGDGLSRSERTALTLLREGPLSREALFERVSAAEEARWLGDLPFFRRLDKLAAGPEPLVETPGDRLTLTAVGRAVLAGERDWLTIRPIDRWLGGTHLRPGRVWRWDAGHRLPIRDP